MEKESRYGERANHLGGGDTGTISPYTAHEKYVKGKDQSRNKKTGNMEGGQYVTEPPEGRSRVFVQVSRGGKKRAKRRKKRKEGKRATQKDP